MTWGDGKPIALKLLDAGFWGQGWWWCPYEGCSWWIMDASIIFYVVLVELPVIFSYSWVYAPVHVPSEMDFQLKNGG